MGPVPGSSPDLYDPAWGVPFDVLEGIIDRDGEPVLSDGVGPLLFGRCRESYRGVVEIEQRVHVQIDLDRLGGSRLRGIGIVIALFLRVGEHGETLPHHGATTGSRFRRCARRRTPAPPTSSRGQTCCGREGRFLRSGPPVPSASRFSTRCRVPRRNRPSHRSAPASAAQARVTRDRLGLGNPWWASE